MSHEELLAQRASYTALVDNPLPEGVVCQATRLGGVPALELAGTGASGTLLYLHGGGYRIGSAATGAPLAAQLGTRAGTRAYSLDYRLAPEHPFPAAVDDVLAAYEAVLDLRAHGEVAIAGDSAGAGLALAALLVARERGLPMPAAYVGFSGWFDLTQSGLSMTLKEAVDPIFDASDIQEYAVAYLTDHDPRTPHASPLFGDLAGLPPMLLQVGSHEVLLDDSTRLAARAAAFDIDVTLEVYAELTHVFHHGWRQVPEADTALDRAAGFIAGRARTSD